MGCTKVPLFCGFLAREGMRSVSNGLELTWWDLALKRGVIKLDENKTSDPRAWTLDPGTVCAVALMAQSSPADGTVFPQAAGKGARYSEFPPALLRAALLEACLKRPELLEEDAGCGPIRVHDLRATFATLALGCGRSET